MSNISIVIGSWGSYNECNERALGSKWLDLDNFDTYEEIKEELTKQGFKLNGIDEELFIQDIDGISANGLNCDYTHPKDLFELLKEADVISNDYKYELMNEYLFVRNWYEFQELVNNNGSNWDDDIHFYKGYDWSDYGKMIYEEYGYKIPESIENFIDFEAYGQYMGSDYAEETDNGIIEIIR